MAEYAFHDLMRGKAYYNTHFKEDTIVKVFNQSDVASAMAMVSSLPNGIISGTWLQEAKRLMQENIKTTTSAWGAR